MVIEGSDVLFENHTIKEIQEIEKKLRNDIERKKEELRQMVGERYRDLMEAADTISEMKEIAESVTSCMNSIENQCIQLQTSSLQNGILHAIQDKVTEKKKTNEVLYVLAAQMKILMDSPAKIWSSVENKDFLSSVSLYFLARHTHSLLVLNPVNLEQNILLQFPIINRQWASISQFRAVLMQNSQNVLELQDSEPEDILGPLICICLLSNNSIQQMFLDYLNTRKNIIQNIFHPEKSTKVQVCEFVNVVQMTLKAIYVAFYPLENISTDNGYERNMLHYSIKKLISSTEPGPVSLLDLKSSETFNFLPKEITDFRPVLSCPLEPCSLEFLQLKCKDWLLEIKTLFLPEIKDLLNYVKSIKNLSLIQEAICERLLEIKNFDVICSDLLNKQLFIWDFFFKDCFLQRIETIINDSVKTTSELCQKNIEETLHKIGFENVSSKLKFERNMLLYIWSESSQDVLENVAWHPRRHRNFWDSGELSMKSLGFTPKVQSICKEMDQQIHDTLEDISFFSRFPIEKCSDENKHFLKEFLIEVNKESNTIIDYLKEAIKKYMSALVNFIESNLKYLQCEEAKPEKSYRIVFLGHICNGISYLCPHINTALSCEKLGDAASEKVKKKGISLFPSASAENEHWKNLKRSLMNTSASSFKMWSEDQINSLIISVESELVTDSVEGLLKILLQWDKVEIQEESEQGNAVNSILRIPQHISTPVSNALFAFCCKLNEIGGFSIDSDVRSSISQALLIALLDVYKKKIFASSHKFSARLLQVQSLQLLFDVHFFMGLMLHKDIQCETINAISQEIIQKAVSQIDPFDMDVFSVPFQQNIKKALQKSLSLFGLITSSDQVSYLNSYKSLSMGGQMDHNVMLISATGVRFPLLPLPSRTLMTSSQEQLHTKESEIKSMQSHSSSPNLTVCDTPTNPLRSPASFYEKVTAMSSSWFGN